MNAVAGDWKTEIPHPRGLMPMPLWMAILMFGVPSALETVSLYVILPAIARQVTHPVFWWFLLCYLAPLSLLLPAAYIGYRLEGNPPQWEAFKARFNIKPLNGAAWVWVGGWFFLGWRPPRWALPAAGWLRSRASLHLRLSRPSWIRASLRFPLRSWASR